MAEPVLILSLLPLRFATRSRKASELLKHGKKATFLSLSKVGRNGMWDRAGEWVDDDLRVVQVPIRSPSSAPSRKNQIANISRSYIPAFFRLLRVAMRTPASAVFVNGTYLLPVALAHKARFGSQIVLDVNERPGMVDTLGSVATIFSRVEIRFLRLAARGVTAASVVTYADVDILRSLGFKTVHLVRNVPLSSWKAPWRESGYPGSRSGTRPLRVLAMGTIYEGRGYEKLIQAVALASTRLPVELILCGPGRDHYKHQLNELADSLNVGAHVRFEDRVESTMVSSMYLDADVGMVLYESHDRGNDGLSNKLFECVTSGRPVIASDLPENREFVTSHGVGWLVGDSPEEISDAIVDAGSQVDLVKLSQHCRAVGDESLNWEQEFDPLLRHFS